MDVGVVGVDEALASQDRALEECRAVAVWALSESELVDFLDAVQAHVQGAVESSLRAVREVDGRGLAVGQGARGTVEWLRDRYRVRKDTAQRLDNAVLLCGHHHRLLHHSPWQVRINPADGLPEFVPPAYLGPEQKPQRNRYHRRQ